METEYRRVEGFPPDDYTYYNVYQDGKFVYHLLLTEPEYYKHTLLLELERLVNEVKFTDWTFELICRLTETK